MRSSGVPLRGERGIKVGGSELLQLFFEEALRLGARRLEILVPYVNDAAFDDAAFRRVWQRLTAMAATTVVVRTTSAAEVLLRIRTQNAGPFDLRLNPRLHAKVFLAHAAGAQIVLVGSQNLTGAALRTNEEMGILITPAGTDELCAAARRLRESVEGIVRESTPCCTTRSALNVFSRQDYPVTEGISPRLQRRRG